MVRPIWHYAKRGTPDANRFEQSEQGKFLMRSMEALASIDCETRHAKGDPDGR